MRRPLASLLAAVAVVAAAWALLVPPWQVPDEAKHFAYVETLAERGDVPSGARPAFATDETLARAASQASEAAGAESRKPEWSAAAYRGWRAAYARLRPAARHDGGGATRASANSPLYYALELPAYEAASGGDTFARLYAMRLWSALTALAATAFVWLLAGEALGRRPLLQLTAAAVVGLQPLLSFVSAGVNPDGLLVAAWAGALWLCARILRRGLTGATAAWLTVITGVAAAVKPGGYALVPAAAAAIGLGVWRRRARSPNWRRLAIWSVAAVVVVGIAVAALLSAAGPATPLGHGLRGLGTVRGFLTYLWEFYLPRLPSMPSFAQLPPMPAWDAWIATGWGGFGSQEIRFPVLVYAVLAGASAVALGGAGLALARARRSLDVGLLVVFALGAGALVLGLHWSEYSLITNHGPHLAASLRRLREIPLDRVAGNALMRGRYLLPLLPLGGLAAAAAVTLVPARRRAIAVGGVLGSLAALQVAALAIVAARFYA